jgi:hypothetical protein
LPGILDRGLVPGENYWDWLGHGIYFFEAGKHHAHAYAEKYCDGGPPCVVEAEINMNGCLDFFDLPAKAKYVEEYDAYYHVFGRENMKRLRQDDRRRPVDCAVFNFMYANLEQEGVPVPVVRCMFESGGPAWEDHDEADPRRRLSSSGVSALGHVQILVRDPAAIIGPLRPSEDLRSRHDG